MEIITSSRSIQRDERERLHTNESHIESLNIFSLTNTFSRLLSFVCVCIHLTSKVPLYADNKTLHHLLYPVNSDKQCSPTLHVMKTFKGQNIHAVKRISWYCWMPLTVSYPFTAELSWPHINCQSQLELKNKSIMLMVFVDCIC